MITEDMHRRARTIGICVVCATLCFAIYLPLFVELPCIVASIALLVLETIAYKAYRWSEGRQQTLEACIKYAPKHEVETK